jgi:predicted Zn-dependent protease
MNIRAVVGILTLSAAVAGVPGPAAGEQIGGIGKIGSMAKKVQQFQDVQMTDEEEQKLGAAVSERIRARYGVVQNAAVHKYVGLVGGVLAAQSSRPGLAWKFIVLDTDGVNAFAAPGGYVHVTKGALALMKDESELAGVLGHELIHVTEKHTIRAIQKGKLVQMGADETLSSSPALFDRLVESATNVVLNGFGQGEELESDEDGITLVNKVGYAPQGLGSFLSTLQDRNKESGEKKGLFASHPAMKERLDKLSKEIASAKLASTATVADRYKKNITYKPVAIAEIATVEAGSAGLAGGSAKAPEKKEEEPKKKGGFGLAALAKPGGGEKKSAQVTGAGSGRGVDTERNAKGGDNPKIVAVTIVAADLAAFRKEGGLK